MFVNYEIIDKEFMEISEKEYKELKSHSQMLGTIGSYVEDFCDEEDTVLTGVMKLLADYYALRGENLMFLANQYENFTERT